MGFTQAQDGRSAHRGENDENGGFHLHRGRFGTLSTPPVTGLMRSSGRADMSVGRYFGRGPARLPVATGQRRHGRSGRGVRGGSFLAAGLALVVLLSVVATAAPQAETSEALLGRAREAYQAGRLDEAVRLADQAVEAASSDGSADTARARLSRAVIYEGAGRWADALGDYTHALEAFPRMSEIHNRRGALYFKMGRIDESISDFDKAVELDPRSDPHHWQRGISYYYAGRFAECIGQFERHRTVNADDVENAFWHFLCKAAQDGVEAARAGLLPVGPDSRLPMMTVYALLRGEAQVEDVLAAAKGASGSSARRDAALFYAHLYIGLYHEALGERDAAKLHITKAAREFRFEHYMGDVARVHAERMRDKR